MADEHDPDDHDAATCPQCRAMFQQTLALGGMAEAMQRLIDNGTLERLGREAAERDERAFMDAFFGGEPPVIVETK